MYYSLNMVEDVEDDIYFFQYRLKRRISIKRSFFMGAAEDTRPSPLKLNYIQFAEAIRIHTAAE